MSERKSMSVEDCIIIKQQISMFAQLLLPMQLSEFVEQINYEESIGPILDPTMFRKNMDEIQQLKQLAKAALNYQNEVKKILPAEMQEEIMSAWDVVNDRSNAPSSDEIQ